MSHNPRHPYDEASDIINQQFPSLAAANGIMRDAFPAAATADRILAEAGMIPRRGRGGVFEGGGPGPERPARTGTITAGNAESAYRLAQANGIPVSYPGGVALPRGGRPGDYAGPRTSLGGPGGRGATWGAGGSGPHRRDPSVVGGLIRKDTAGTVNINRWSDRMKAHGIPGEWILEAYNAAGGSADLSAEQRAGNTQDFLGDFTEALEDLGADPDVLLVSYQEAGGRIGKGPGGSGGRRGPGGFLGGAARAGQDVVDTVAKAGSDVAAEIDRAIKRVF